MSTSVTPSSQLWSDCSKPSSRHSLVFLWFYSCIMALHHIHSNEQLLLGEISFVADLFFGGGLVVRLVHANTSGTS